MAANTEHLGLHGRQAEYEKLARLVDGLRDRGSAALVIYGESGTGKTELLGFAAGLAADLQVVRAAGAEPETELAYAGLHRLCGPMFGLLGCLPEPQRDALEIAFGMREGRRPDRFLVGLAVLGLLAESVADRPLVCVVDDVHWLDQASRQALGFAARRLATRGVLMIFAAPERITDLDGLPTMTLGGLRDADARDLIASVVHWPLDGRVRDQIVAETRGIPRALLRLLQGVPPAQLAGGFGLSDVLSDRASDALLAELSRLPDQTRQLLLVAAADPTGDPALVRRAAGQLGITGQAALPAAEAGLITFDGRVVFRDPVVRATAYRAARLGDRHNAHRALAQATHPGTDPDRRAWHLAQVLTEPDEDVAGELERRADRAQERGGIAAKAAFLERAAMATPDAERRTERCLAAAAVMLQAGEASAAAKLLGMAEADTLDDHRQARAHLVQARLAFTADRGADSSQLLLDAARQLSRFDAAEARVAYLDAIRAALLAGRQVAPGGTMTDVAHAAREAAGAGRSGPADVLLADLAAGFSGEFTAGAPFLRRAVKVIGREATAAAELSLLPLACAGALQLWDDRALDALASRYVSVTRSAGAVSDLPSALNALAFARLLAGDLAAADSLTQEAQTIAEAAGSRAAPYSALGVAAVRGREDAARALIDGTWQDAALRGEGLGMAAAKWATAVLHNGLGRYAEALSAAEEAIEHAGPPAVAGWPMAELIEAAARTGQPGRATRIMRSLSHITVVAGTDWALGVRARSLALLNDREDLYQAAIEYLGRSHARVDLARAHLLYGEWLRHKNRRVDARAQLHLAHEMLGAAGAEGFAERSRRELHATGETVRSRTVGPDGDLTPQEIEIAARARDGKTNSEIGAELFLSPRTVEWHLRKVFPKLGITSRRELPHALPGAIRAAR